ncbi:MAG: sigma-54 dependent transcriptional regulator, partial [Rhodocyclaceae bacterium]|nr:sigma-54 dependent transcriptional regulator [Rhodocyclaceae bacterium]
CGQALARLKEFNFELVICDVNLGDQDGFQLLEWVAGHKPETAVILITGYATLESAIEAMKHGAFYYIAKPFRLDEVRKVVAEALDKVRLRRENAALRAEVERFQGKVRIITQNAPMQRLLELARQIAPTDCNVLISGESGTGKELFARYVHHHSKRANGPFIAINCGAFNEDLLANELFGHRKGAFTGAQGDKKGLVSAADGGTLFLDEVTEMSPAMQVKLLRVIQEREVLPLGATQPHPIDVRFVAATNRDIVAMTKKGDFRQDLFFRLNVVHLVIPPLAARREDILPLAYHFLGKCAARMGKDVTEISAAAIDLLTAYDFPGNVRELENLIERGVAIATGNSIEVGALPDELRAQAARTFRKKEGRLPSLQEQERDYIQWVLQETGGNQTLAAQILGIDRVSLWRKLKRYQEE